MCIIDKNNKQYAETTASVFKPPPIFIPQVNNIQ